jgi:predicted dehydrogenase
MSPEILARYGYESMHELRNWRWYRKYGGGPISDLGAHQIDIFNWFFGAMPSSVMASGGADFYPDFEMYDNVMAIYEYALPEGPARAFYQVLTTTSSLGYLERFMGVEGTLAISENPRWNQVYREAYAAAWDKWVEKGYLVKSGPGHGAESDTEVVDVRETAPLDAWDIPVELTKPIHQPHLENFFSAIRDGTSLTCPGETGFRTAVTVMKVNQAVAGGKRLEFHPGEFEI